MQKDKEIKHVWFDLNGTLCLPTPEFNKAHDLLRYETYAEVKGQSVTTPLKAEYEKLYEKCGSNSAVFRSLGLPADYWMKRFNMLEEGNFYQPIPEIYETLEILKDIIPISLFTNNSPQGTAKILDAIKVQQSWFTNMITGDQVPERKPHLYGFKLVIEKSKIPAKQILYVGDRINVDVRPAKTVGIQTCLVYSSSDEADYSFDKFEDILSLFVK